jgi:probable rRNA maturation factor
MITFNYETKFNLEDENAIEKWVQRIIKKYCCEVGELNFIFCDDVYLHKINIEFLHHDTLTDIISFDNSLGSLISGDIYISIERVEDNSRDFKVSFQEELQRVMIHGILHYLGFKDKTKADKEEMTAQENEALLMLNK